MAKKRHRKREQKKKEKKKMGQGRLSMGSLRSLLEGVKDEIDSVIDNYIGEAEKRLGWKEAGLGRRILKMR